MPRDLLAKTPDSSQPALLPDTGSSTPTPHTGLADEAQRENIQRPADLSVPKPGQTGQQPARSRPRDLLAAGPGADRAPRQPRDLLAGQSQPKQPARKSLVGWARNLGKAALQGVVGSVAGSVEGAGILARQAGAETAGSAVQGVGERISEVGQRLTPDEEYQGVATDLAAGVGSMGTYLAPGAAAARMTRGASQATQIGAGLGAATAMAGPAGVAEAYNRAVASGMDEEQAIETSLPGFGAGAVQVAPVALILRGIPQHLRGQALAKARHVIEAGLGEFVAEGSGAVLQNLIEKSYNPERGTWDDSLYQAAIGGSAGALLDLGVLALTRGRGVARGPAAVDPSATPEPTPEVTPQDRREGIVQRRARPVRIERLTKRLAELEAGEMSRHQETEAAAIREELAALDASPAAETAPEAAPEPAQPLALPAPVVEVTPEGEAGTQAQREAQRREQEALGLAEVERATQARALPPETPETTAEAVEQAAAETDTAPTEAQKEAGNYRKGKVNIQGLDISIENPRGSERSGVGPDGTPWAVTTPAHYGYIKRTEGRDGEQVDVYVGENPESQTVFVVDQMDADTGRFDEHKAMMGFDSEANARAIYEAAFDDGRAGERLGAITEMSVDEFKAWLEEGDTRKPLQAPMRRAEPVETETAGAADTEAETPAAEAEAESVDLTEAEYRESQRLARQKRAAMARGDSDAVDSLEEKQDALREKIKRREAVDDAEFRRALARSKLARDRYKRESRVDESQDDLLTAIAKLGGMSRAEAEAHGVDPADFSRRGWKIKRVFTTKGDTADGLAENLAQYGYPVFDSQGNYDANVFLDALHRALAGEAVYAPAAQEKMVEQMLEQREQEIESPADLDAEAGITIERPDEGAGPDWLLVDEAYDGLETSADQHLLDISEYVEATGLSESEIEAIIERGAIQELTNHEIEQQLFQAAGQRVGGESAAEAAGEPAAGDQAGVARPLLETHTEADLDAREAEHLKAEQRKAEEAAKAEARAEADQERDQFALTGSSRPADVLAAQGQQDLLAQPKKSARPREAWQMTGLEYTQSRVPGATAPSQNMIAQHRKEVSAAIERGEDVPANVLAEYPELSTPARRDETQREIYDRRVDDIHDIGELREYIEQLRREVMVDERTGLGSNRAWLNREPKAFVASIDLDSLKWVNDNMGHEAGDRMIELVGQALREAGLGADAAHISGDEFYVQADTRDALDQALAAAREWLATQSFEGNGLQYTGAGFSYGVGRALNDAELKLHGDKNRRERAGERAARGERPAGVTDATRPDPEPGEAPADRAEAAADRQGGRAERSEPDVTETEYERETSDIQGRERGVREPAKPRAEARPGPDAVQRDLFDDAKALPAETAKDQIGDNFLVSFQQVEIGTLASGLDAIKTAEDAAHVLAPIRKHAQETMMAAVVAGDGRILNVIRHTKGLKDAAMVDPMTLVSAIAATDGADGVWFGHNHPSGTPTASAADKRTTRVLTDALNGTDINVRGHVVLGHGGRAEHLSSRGELVDIIRARPMPRSRRVPVTERMIRKQPAGEQVIIERADALIEYVDKNVRSENALILKNNKGAVVGVVSMTPEEMSTLREHGRARRVLEAIDRTNASGVFIVSTDMDAARNLAKFLNNIHPEGPGQSKFVTDVLIRQDDAWASDMAGQVEGSRAWDSVSAATGAFYSRARERPRLSVLHNLHEQNLIFADQMGGLAVPSMAVVKEGMGLSGMGNITLIGRSNMGDPKRVPIYDADAYTSTFPKPDYRPVASKKADAFVSELRPWVKKYEDHDHIIHVVFDDMANTPRPDEEVARLTSSNAAKAWYLKEKHGINVNPVIRDVPLEFQWSADHQFVEEYKALREEVGDAYQSQIRDKDSHFVREVTAAARRAIDRYIEANPDESKILRHGRGMSDLRNALASSWGVEGAWASDKKEVMPFPQLMKLESDAGKVGQREVDRYATKDRIDRRLKKREADFHAWVSDKVLSLFGAPTLKVGGRRVPYTLDNIVEKMTERGTQAREETLAFGEGKARAEAAKLIEDLVEMRNRAKHQIADKEQLEKAREESKAAMEKWREDVLEYYGERDYRGNIDTWNGLDASMRAIAKMERNALKRGRKQALETALRQEGFRGVPDSVIDDGTKAGALMMEAPVPYFEAKPERAVMLEEFAGAVIPASASKQVRGILDRHGIPYKTYRGEGRQERAADEFRKELARQGEDVLFRRADPAQAGFSVSEAQKTVADTFGQTAQRLMENGQLRIVATELGLPRHLDDGGSIAGVHDPSTGISYIVARNVDASNIRGIFLHEVGVHHGLRDRTLSDGTKRRGLLTEKKFNELASQLKRLEKEGDLDSQVAIAEARRLLEEANVPDAQFAEELVAYVVQTHANNQVAPAGIRAWLKQLFDAIRAALWRTGLRKNLSLDEMTALARGAVDAIRPEGVVGAAAATDPMFAKAPPTDSDAFKRWFGESKVVDENGEPMVMYHTTLADFDSFEREMIRSRYPYSIGFHFTDARWEANAYTRGRDGPRPDDVMTYEGANIMPVYLQAEKPLIIETDHPAASMEADLNRSEIIEKLHSAMKRGEPYDSVIIQRDGEDGYDHMNVIVFQPEQIKSATGNRGTFDPADPNILYSRADTARPDEAELQKVEERAKAPVIESHIENIARTRGFFDSVSDVLRRQEAFRPVADAIDNYYDKWDAYRGRIHGSEQFLSVMEKLRKLRGKERKEALAQFEKYQAANNNQRKAEAKAIREQGGVVAEMIEATEWMYDTTGTLNQTVTTPDGQVGVKVYDPKIKGWRRIGKIPPKDMWSRTLNRDVANVLHRDGPQGNPELWNRLVDALMTEGKIQSPEEAWRYVTDYFTEESMTDYFAGMEKARTEPLPEIFYDYSWDAAIEYGNRWAQRISQIEHFGQKTSSQSKDLIERAIDEAGDERTRLYLTAVRDDVYMSRTRQPFDKLIGTMNVAATGLQLANPFTALRNWGTGLLYNWANYGSKATALAYKDMAIQGRRAWQTAVSAGVLKEDLLMMQHDMLQQGVAEGLVKATTKAMKIGGYTFTERFIRVHAMLTGKHFLLDALHHWNRNPSSAKSKRYMAFMQRHNIDTDTLLAEAGHGPETDKWLRLAVNIPQGSYKINMVPLFVDTPIGRFLWKYQKYGTQRSREFWQNGLRPFLRGDTVVYTDKQGVRQSERVRSFHELLRYLVVPLVGGTPLAILLSKIFGTQDPGPGLDELEEALKDDDRRNALALLAARAWYSAMTLGSLGFFSSPAQLVKDIEDRQRMKSPLSPPGIAPIESMLELGLKYVDQGTLTARDFDDTLNRTISFYRATKRGGLTALNLVTDEVREGQLEAAKRDRYYVRKMTRRYADEAGLTRKRRASGGIAKTPMSPVNRQILDALLLGEAETARAIMANYLMTLETQDEIDRALSSMRGAVRSFQPSMVSLSPSEANRRQFLEWLDGKVSEDNYQRVIRADETYRRAAIQSGLMGRPQERRVRRDAIRRERAQRPMTEMERRAYLRRKLRVPIPAQ